MRAGAAALALLLLAGCHAKAKAQTVHPGVPAERIPEGIYAADDINALRQGTWKIETQEHDGHPVTDDVSWTFDLDSFDARLNGSFTTKFHYRLDPTQNPKRFAAGPQLLPDGRGANTTGIYRLEGDTFELTVDNSARQFPGDFEAPKGTHFTHYRFRRQ